MLSYTSLSLQSSVTFILGSMCLLTSAESAKEEVDKISIYEA